tara:strand:- start:48 stop:581 length:534 start_codon:yes stop_codon:yes gene_type:complete
LNSSKNRVRQGLTLNGFDNNGNNLNSLGLKQIIVKAYNDGNQDIIDKINSITTYISNNTIELNPTSRTHFQDNAIYLEYIAFEALLAYILEENGITSSISSSNHQINIRPFSVAYFDFKNSNHSLSLNDKLINLQSDYVKSVIQIEGIARALDLYLGIENAFKEFNTTEWASSQSNI